jgi:putative membrane protein
MRGTQLCVAVIVALSVTACGNGYDRASNSGTPGAAGTSGRAGLSMGERNFVQDQLNDGSREIQLGQLAEKHAASADVKQFASMMVQDHTRAGNKLEEVARRENVQADDSNKNTRDDIERLSKLSGTEFDKEYMNLMVKDHKDAVDALQDQAQNADNTEVKTWAAETLPRMKRHLEEAQQIEQQLNNAEKTTAAKPRTKS